MDFTSNFAWIEGTDIDEEVLRNNQTMKTGCFDDNNRSRSIIDRITRLV